MSTFPDIIERLSHLLEQRYVLPDRVPEIVESLAALDGTIREQDGDSDTLATSLNDALLAASKDRHLRVRPRPSPKADGDDVEWQSRMRREAIDNAGGIRSVTRAEGRATVITIAPYLSSVELAGPYVEAAFRLAAAAEHLVLDVRDGRGGTPETVALICGHLLGDRAVHLQDVIERDGSRRQFWTTPQTHRLPEMVPVSLLTNSLTFSGCEELAYDLQALGRAAIVGERTMGGAHPVSPFPLTDTLEVNIPVAMSSNTITGTNWEGTGVTPDIPCAAGDALTAALEQERPLHGARSRHD